MHSFSLFTMLKQHELKIRYLLVGGFNTVFGIVFYFALRYISDFFIEHYFVALLFAQAVCTTTAYFLYKFIVFRTKGNYGRELMAFFSSYYVNYALNWLALPFFVEIFRIDPAIVQAVFVTAMVIAGFFFHSKVTFRGSPSSASTNPA